MDRGKKVVNESSLNADRVDELRQLAGEGDLDERCRNLLAHFRDSWYGPPPEEPEEPEEPEWGGPYDDDDYRQTGC